MNDLCSLLNITFIKIYMTRKRLFICIVWIVFNKVFGQTFKVNVAELNLSKNLRHYCTIFFRKCDDLPRLSKSNSILKKNGTVNGMVNFYLSLLSTNISVSLLINYGIVLRQT